MCDFSSNKFLQLKKIIFSSRDMAPLHVMLHLFVALEGGKSNIVQQKIEEVILKMFRFFESLKTT